MHRRRDHLLCVHWRWLHQCEREFSIIGITTVDNAQTRNESFTRENTRGRGCGVATNFGLLPRMRADKNGVATIKGYKEGWRKGAYYAGLIRGM